MRRDIGVSADTVGVCISITVGMTFSCIHSTVLFYQQVEFHQTCLYMPLDKLKSRSDIGDLDFIFKVKEILIPFLVKIFIENFHYLMRYPMCHWHDSYQTLIYITLVQCHDYTMFWQLLLHFQGQKPTYKVIKMRHFLIQCMHIH